MGEAAAVLTYKLVGLTNDEHVFDQAMELDASSLTPAEDEDAGHQGHRRRDRCGMPKSMTMTMTMTVDGPVKMEMVMTQTRGRRERLHHRARRWGEAARQVGAP